MQANKRKQGVLKKNEMRSEQEMIDLLLDYASKEKAYARFS
jgi:hypothetical protein